MDPFEGVEQLKQSHGRLQRGGYDLWQSDHGQFTDQLLSERVFGRDQLFEIIRKLLPYQREGALNSTALIKVALLATVLLAAYFLLTGRDAEMRFVELSSPQGFRELVLDTRQFNTADLLTIGIPGRERSASNQFDSNGLCSALFKDPNSPRAGRDDTPVRLAIFTDYRCTYCRRLTKDLLELQGTGKVQVLFKEWPVLGDSSVLAARAALAAAKQGQYDAFHQRLMKSRLVPTRHYIEALANELSLDVPRLLDDMSSADVSAALKQSADLATALRLTGTPALVVGRTIVRGEISRSDLERLIAIEATSHTNQMC
jgi:protein-disulfide isomerase